MKKSKQQLNRRAPTPEKILELLAQGFNRTEIADMHGVCKQRISAILPRWLQKDMLKRRAEKSAA